MTQLTGIRIDVAGDLATVGIDGTTSQSRLSGMYEAITCSTVDVVGLDGEIDLWVDDEGLYMQEPNPTLTAMVRITNPFQTHLSGPGLFLGTNEDGDTVSLTTEQAFRVIDWWQRATANPAMIPVRL
jgi:hypothetical protein